MSISLPLISDVKLRIFAELSAQQLGKGDDDTPATISLISIELLIPPSASRNKLGRAAFGVGRADRKIKIIR